MVAKYLFNRKSPVLKIVEFLGYILFAAAIFNGVLKGRSVVGYIFFGLFAFEVILLRFCTLKKWDQFGEEGINVHFEKMLIPLSYIVFISGLWAILTKGLFFAYLSSKILLPLAYINLVLLYLRRKEDKFIERQQLQQVLPD